MSSINSGIYKLLLPNESIYQKGNQPLNEFIGDEYISTFSESSINFLNEDNFSRTYNPSFYDNRINSMSDIIHQNKPTNFEYIDASEITLKSQMEDEHHLCIWENCEKQFKTMREMIIHLEEFHIGSRQSNYICCVKNCKRNKQAFTKKHKILNHLKTHTGEKPYICTINNCNKVFSRLDCLNTHQKTHNSVRPHKCPIRNCNRSYYHIRSLRKHIGNHQQ